MSLLIAGPSPGAAVPSVFEAAVDGESTGEGFGDLLAQLFAVTTGVQPAVPGVVSPATEAPTEMAEESGEGSEELLALESLLTLPNQQAAPAVAPPTEAQTAPVATGADVQPELAGPVPAESSKATAVTEQTPAAISSQDAPLASEASTELPTASPAEDQALEPALGASPEAATLPEAREQKALVQDAASPEPASEPQQSVVRPVGNADASSGNNEGNPEKGRPQFANNVVAAAHNAPQTGGAAVAEAAQQAGANPEPQIMAPEQVVEAVIERAEAGGGEVNIRLDPPDLGEVTIRVITDGDSVRVHIQAERPEAAQLLRNAAGALESLLSERGLDLSDVFVGAEQRGSQQSFENQSQSREDQSSTPFSAFFDAPPGAEVRQHNRIRSAYNPDGALLYRV
jgi:flagellar hook-length control protein FliK